MHRITLNVGDPGHDGHNLSDEFIFETNTSASHIIEAFTKQGKLLGIASGSQFNFCGDYEEHKVPKEIFDILNSSLNLDFIFGTKDSYPEYKSKYDNWFMEPEEMAKLYLEIAKLEIKDLQYALIKTKNSIDIGGYGLYYN